MFTPEDRSRLREDLLKEATEDLRISGAAITGSDELRLSLRDGRILRRHPIFR